MIHSPQGTAPRSAATPPRPSSRRTLVQAASRRACRSRRAQAGRLLSPLKRPAKGCGAVSVSSHLLVLHVSSAFPKRKEVRLAFDMPTAGLRASRHKPLCETSAGRRLCTSNELDYVTITHVCT